MQGERILIVDDDDVLRALIATFLREGGYQVREAQDVPALRAALAADKPDLIILDQMMPGEDGLTALRTLPAQRPPVIMLSSMSDDVDRIIGIESGADDYVAKPCNPRELLARVRAVLRRGQPPATSEVLRFGGWRLDGATHELTAPDGAPVELTTGEFRLLRLLAEGERKVRSRDALSVQLSGEEYGAFDRAIDLTVSRVRRKLAAHDPAPVIRTVRGEGYAMAVDVERE